MMTIFKTVGQVRLYRTSQTQKKETTIMSNTRLSGTARGDAAHQTHAADNPAPEAGMSRDTINIGL